MVSRVSRRVWVGTFPRVMRIWGAMREICLWRKGKHVALSLGSGVALLGGRHLTILPM